MLPGMIPAIGSTGAADAGIVTTNLQLHLDVGNSACVADGTTQNCLDLTTNSYDFYRGATSGAEASDPTFNGTAGNLSSSEYYSFDGGDYLVTQAAYASSILRAVARSGQEFSLEIWLYPNGITTRQFLFGNSTLGGGDGCRISITTGSKFSIEGFPGGTASSTTSLTDTTWQQIGLSGNLNGTGVTFWLNGSSDGTASPNNSSWTTGDSSQAAEICGWAGGTEPLLSGARMAIYRIYDADIGSAGFLQNYDANKGRFGLS